MGWYTISLVRLQGPAVNITMCSRAEQSEGGLHLAILCALAARYGQCDDSAYTTQSILMKKELLIIIF